jgi:hypothetical protein
MMKNKNQLGLVIGVVFWLTAALVQGIYHGLLNGITNPFLWLFSLMETMEFTLWLSQEGSFRFFLENLGSREAGKILAGVLGLIAWLTTIVMGNRFRRKKGCSGVYILGLVWYYPVVAILTAGWLLRSTVSSGRDQEQVAMDGD